MYGWMYGWMNGDGWIESNYTEYTSPYSIQFSSLSIQFLHLYREFRFSNGQSSFLRSHDLSNPVVNFHSSDPLTKTFTCSRCCFHNFRIKVWIGYISVYMYNTYYINTNIFVYSNYFSLIFFMMAGWMLSLSYVFNASRNFMSPRSF